MEHRQTLLILTALSDVNGTDGPGVNLRNPLLRGANVRRLVSQCQQKLLGLLSLCSAPQCASLQSKTELARHEIVRSRLLLQMQEFDQCWQSGSNQRLDKKWTIGGQSTADCAEHHTSDIKSVWRVRHCWHDVAATIPPWSALATLRCDVLSVRQSVPSALDHVIKSAMLPMQQTARF